MINEAEYQGKTVTLNSPFRTPGGPKKFSVYVMNDNGNVVKVNFGDPNMEIKRDDPERRKSFRARHKCSEKKDKTSAGYWSCYQWRAGSKVQESMETEIKPNPTSFSSEKMRKYYWWKQLQCEANMDNNLQEIDLATRRKRAKTMRRLATRLAMARKRSEKRAPTQAKIVDRARKQAINMLKVKLGKKSIADMSTTEKQNIEKRIARIPQVVDRLSRKLIKKVRAAALAKRQNSSAEQKQESIEFSIDSDFIGYMNEKMEDLIMKNIALQSE